MTRRARRGATPGQRLLGLLLAAAVGALLWYAWQSRTAVVPAASSPAPAARPAAALAVAATSVDAANQGRLLDVSGPVRGVAAIEDPQFGIRSEAGAAALVRTVEMFQWREDCAAAKCSYRKEWSAQAIDSAAFREPAGHANDARFPFRGATFRAAEWRLGAFRLDAALAAALPFAAARRTALPAAPSQLPPNLAASLRERDGMLYSGDPERPAVGDLRVSYAVLAFADAQRVRGVQDGDRLVPAPP